MLNKDNIRELAYVVTIDNIEPIEGSDNCEAAVVGGWKIMVRKETFKADDLAVYFEIDSKVPETETFEFLSKKHYRVKTQKYTFGGRGNFISQGFLMHPNDFGWTVAYDQKLDEKGFAVTDENGDPVKDRVIGIVDGSNTLHKPDDESRFLTSTLGVVYASADDNQRKGSGGNKYQKMAQRHPELGKTKWWKWLYKRTWGKKLLFVFFGRKVKTSDWPAWVSKTDEERIQNMPWIINQKGPWIVTEKIDGTSTTFTIKKKKFGKFDFFVCSRNVVFDKPDKKCFYETNVYTEMAEKYNIENVLKEIIKKLDVDWVTIQGETYGAGVQKRTYGLRGHDFAGFNLIDSKNGRWPSDLAMDFIKDYNIPWVPILDTEFYFDEGITIEDAIVLADGNSKLDDEMREGLVIRDTKGVTSFKIVSNDYLVKYHG